jgi:hypothetical protein
VLTLIPLDSSGYQRQDGIKHLQQHQKFSFLGATQMLLPIIQGVKDSITAQNAV